ncbi:hypothetical protein FE257_012614 [Aspergillus nanangensis]|uniref:Non-homologous end-joining factor 1 n=1 Tax=Aspergillus nanangensis TaxID=2582783 RepID=A0AAD4CFW3_ASPNN|nr:hypothetical protein FE257_012614 [Aspergillus nanangensis]
MSGQWERLHISSKTGSPPALLYRYITTTSGYELYMTDLTNIWSEHMTRQAIIEKADKYEATIDPSEDPEQFRILLQTIGNALQNKPETRTTLLKQNSRSNILELITSTNLPAPLAPLTWKLDLCKEPQSSITSHLLLPLIHAEAQREVHQKTLIDQLIKKDWVLGKLFDKIEVIGLDLSTVFPGMSGLRPGRKGTTLAQAAKYIKGVAPFNETAWLDEICESSADVNLAAKIISEISGSKPSKLHPPPDAWWETLPTTSDDLTCPLSAPCEKGEGEVEPRRSNHNTRMDINSGTETEDDDEDDKFERQETSPRLKRAMEEANQAAAPRKEDQKTDKEPGLNPSHPSQQKVPQRPSRGLGMIGGKNKPTKQPSPQPSLPPRDATPSSHPAQAHSVDEPLIDEDQTDSGSDQDDQNSSPLAKTITPQDLSAKPRGLGVIGGKKKEKQPIPTTQCTSPQPSGSKPRGDNSPKTPPLPEAKTKRAGKLGVIGGKASRREIDTSPPRIEATSSQAGGAGTHLETPNVEPAMSVSLERRKPKVQSEEPRQEETEQERADRKREDLKRQLEAKARAPAKKKRKF